MASYLLPLSEELIMFNRNQVLQQYTGWLHTVARNMTNTHLHADLVQEGYIAMWRAFETYDPDKGALDWWLKTAALHKMKSVISGGTMTTNQERKSAAGHTTKKGDETRKRISAYTSANPAASGVEIAKALGISQATLSYQRSKMNTVTLSKNAKETETVSLNHLMDVLQYGAGSGQTKRGTEFTPEELQYCDDLESIEVAYHSGEIQDALDLLTPAQRQYVVARFWGGKTASELKELFGYDPHSLWATAKPKLQLRLGNLRELVLT